MQNTCEARRADIRAGAAICKAQLVSAAKVRTAVTRQVYVSRSHSRTSYNNIILLELRSRRQSAGKKNAAAAAVAVASCGLYLRTTYMSTYMYNVHHMARM